MGTASGKSSNAFDSTPPDEDDPSTDAVPPSEGAGEEVGDVTAAGPTAAAGARSCVPHVHFTILPAASAGTFKTVLHAGHLIFIFAAMKEQYSWPKVPMPAVSITDQNRRLCLPEMTASQTCPRNVAQQSRFRYLALPYSPKCIQAPSGLTAKDLNKIAAAKKYFTNATALDQNDTTAAHMDSIRTRLFNPTPNIRLRRNHLSIFCKVDIDMNCSVVIKKLNG